MDHQGHSEGHQVSNGFKVDVKKPESLEAINQAIDGDGQELMRITGVKIDVVSVNDFTQFFIECQKLGNVEALAQFEAKYPNFVAALRDGGTLSDYDIAEKIVKQAQYMELMMGKGARTSVIAYGEDTEIKADDYGIIFWEEGFVENFPDTLLGHVDCKSSDLIRDFPGTDEELRAIIVLHELEHMTTNQIEDYNNSNDEQYRRNTRIHEVDSDIAAVHNCEGIVSEESLDWFVDARLMRGVYEGVQTNIAYKRTDYEYENGYDRDHDTGFFLKEYRETGEAPDFEMMQKEVDDFYRSVADLCVERMDEQALDYKNGEIPLDVMAGVIQEELNQGDSFTPTQEIMAQQFLDSYTNSGGEVTVFMDYAAENKSQILPKPQELSADVNLSNNI